MEISYEPLLTPQQTQNTFEYLEDCLDVCLEDAKRKMVFVLFNIFFRLQLVK